MVDLNRSRFRINDGPQSPATEVSLKSVVLLSLLSLFAGTATAALWPIVPNTEVQPLGNNWGNYQNYGSRAADGYFHNGIDIITPDRQGAPVVAVAHGWVKGWGTISADLHWRLAISDSPVSFTGRAPGWLYAHIDKDRPRSNVGDEVFPGDTIGYLVPWPGGFDHIHFARISDTGAYWNWSAPPGPGPTWWFIENPLLHLVPSGDLLPPVFENARGSNLFAFCRDNRDNQYLSPDSLHGAVDIIARIYDKTGYTTGNDTWDMLAPFRIEHMIRRDDGLIVRPWTLSFEFSNRLERENVSVVYKWDQRDTTMRSRGDYNRRRYLYIITNTTGDSLIRRSDTTGNWNTAEVGDGNYWVVVRASDHVGNTTVDSMLVRTRNGLGVADLPALLAAPLRPVASPTRGPARLSFALARSAEVELLVMDAVGRVVARPVRGFTGAGRQVLTLPELPAGVYVAELRLNCPEAMDLNRRTKLVITR